MDVEAQSAVLENDRLLVEVSANGAELRRIWSKVENREVLWTGDEKFWSGISPLLFPIAGKVKHDELEMNGKKYEIQKHGFARNSEFTLIENSGSRMVFMMESNLETKRGFPYEFKLFVSCEIQGSSVLIEWIVKNTDDRPIYFSIGGHPAFSIPHESQEEAKEYVLLMEGNKEIKEYTLNPPFISGEKKINNPGSLELHGSLFENDTLIYSGLNSISISNQKNGIKRRIDFKGFPYVAIWTPTYDQGTRIAPFICIEPWYGIADYENANGKIEDKAGIQRLPVAESFTASYEIHIGE